MANQLLSHITLTSHQKQVLVLAYIAATPSMAHEDVMGDIQLTTAAELLADLGAVDLSDAGIVVTDEGKQLLKDAALIDDSDQLTDDAMQLVPSDVGAPPPQQPPLDGMSDELSGSDIDPFEESWSLIRFANNQISG